MNLIEKYLQSDSCNMTAARPKFYDIFAFWGYFWIPVLWYILARRVQTRTEASTDLRRHKPTYNGKDEAESSVRNSGVAQSHFIGVKSKWVSRTCQPKALMWTKDKPISSGFVLNPRENNIYLRWGFHNRFFTLRLHRDTMKSVFAIR